MPISNDTVQPGGDGIRQLYFCCSKNIVMALLWPHKCYLNSLPAFYPELLLVATSAHHTRHVTVSWTHHGGPVSSDWTRVKCPVTVHVSSVQDTCPLTFTGQVAVLGPPIAASHQGGHLAGHPGIIIITCCSQILTNIQHPNGKLFFHSISKARQ